MILFLTLDKNEKFNRSLKKHTLIKKYMGGEERCKLTWSQSITVLSSNLATLKSWALATMESNPLTETYRSNIILF